MLTHMTALTHVRFLSSQIRNSCCGKQENALDFYKCRIQEYDDFAEKDYDTIVERRLKVMRSLNSQATSTSRPESSEGRSSSFDFIPDVVREALGMHSSDLFCSTAIVEFKSISAKQSGECQMVHCLLLAFAVCI